jgi:hypothetical protein
VTRRILISALAATLAVVGLAGCRTNTGVAARVNDHAISESDVNDFLRPGGPDKSAAARSGGQVASPRSQILTFLIQEQVFRRTLASIGQHPSDGELAGLHDAAASLLLNTQLTGADLDNELRRQLPISGIKADFADIFLRVQELEVAIINNKRLQQLPELLALIKKAGVKVSVAPRYGSWDAGQLAVDGKPAIPSFLSVQPSPGAASQASTGG